MNCGALTTAAASSTAPCPPDEPRQDSSFFANSPCLLLCHALSNQTCVVPVCLGAYICVAQTTLTIESIFAGREVQLVHDSEPGYLFIRLLMTILYFSRPRTIPLGPSRLRKFM